MLRAGKPRRDRNEWLLSATADEVSPMRP